VPNPFVIVITGPFWQDHFWHSAGIGFGRAAREVFAKRELNVLAHLSETVQDLRLPMKTASFWCGALSRCHEPKTSVAGLTVEWFANT
jgi:hypothetical protein